MNSYLYKQFYRNKAYVFALIFLMLAGIMGIYTGKKFLDRNADIISKSTLYQKQSIEKNVHHHANDLGLLLYYLKQNYVNTTPKLASLSIGLRDLNPSIQGLTIRNLEEQRYNSDFYNPANAATGNFDFNFVLVFLFPLIILAFCYNLISEEEETGTWKLLSVQSANPTKFLDYKMLVRFTAICIVYFLLILIAVVWIDIPVDGNFAIFVISGWLYILFWFLLCRWVISFRKSSAQNALTLLVIWMFMNFIVPMSANQIIQKAFPVQESLEAVIEQREGYHHKWDEAKQPTMDQFYKIYPQFSNYKVDENASSSWVWYYAMQHLGDVEASASSQAYTHKMQKRNDVASYLGYLFPNIHAQLVGSEVARTDMSNQLRFAAGLQKYHENKRLFFYPLIFSGQTASAVNWNLQTVEFYNDTEKINLVKTLLPYFIIITLLLILSQIQYRKLC